MRFSESGTSFAIVMGVNRVKNVGRGRSVLRAYLDYLGMNVSEHDVWGTDYMGC